ncbi:MAG: HD domain-containing protein [Oscillospiraceae bacterium]|nr:HD domain-containing protein [Oscillospiraceae bacterium]
MVTLFYDSVFLISIVLSLLFVRFWHKHFDVHITLVFVLVPFTCLCYPMLVRAQTLEAALVANRLSYIGACYLLLIITLSVFSLCSIELPRYVRLLMFCASTFVYLSALLADKYQLFYRSITMEIEDGVPVFHKEYSFMHTVFICMVILYFLMIISAMAYSLAKKKQVSRKNILLLFLPIMVCMFCYFGGRKITDRVELLPAGYVFAQIVYLIIAHRLCLYDITDISIDSMVERGDTGFVSFDFSFHYLGSNLTAKRILPELEELTVDMPASTNETVQKQFLSRIKIFSDDPKQDHFYYERDEHIYLVRMTYLFDGSRKRGFQLFLTDDTKNQKYIDLINRFNTSLKAEVEEKTAHIVEMHDHLITSMAAMVESRDNSTGGHIKRTSEDVRILVDEIRHDPDMPLSESFCRCIIKAAPMHDLGKIAVDDAVLRKPGRFTDEEFAKMKIHAAEGARIVHEILKSTDDEVFRHIAENVAHYHHERWDGSGYPEGLRGEEIPLEARIMAIADVYDALVSKRVYKDSMSFEQADAIIMDGMGKHFDKRLEKYYVSARPKLEAYYTSLAQAAGEE